MLGNARASPGVRDAGERPSAAGAGLAPTTSEVTPRAPKTAHARAAAGCTNGLIASYHSLGLPAYGASCPARAGPGAQRTRKVGRYDRISPRFDPAGLH